jgi:predicted TIM-barrel enzyme
VDGIQDLRRRIAGRGPLEGTAGPDPAGDFWVVHNAGRRPNLLLGLLPLGDANAATLDLLKRAAAGAGRPVVAGLCATDPFRDRDLLIEEVRGLGASGVINLPSVGMIDGQFGRSLEGADLGYGREVELIRAARRAGLLALGLAFTEEQGRRMAETDLDAVVFRGDPGALSPDVPLLVWSGTSIVPAPRGR